MYSNLIRLHRGSPYAKEHARAHAHAHAHAYAHAYAHAQCMCMHIHGSKVVAGAPIAEGEQVCIANGDESTYPDPDPSDPSGPHPNPDPDPNP